MTNEEIRQKAKECRKSRIEECCKHRDKIGSGECPTCKYYEPNVDCMTIYAYEHGFADGFEEGKRQKATWIPVTERLPECEEAVLVTVERRLMGGKPYHRVIKAFYEDGNINTEDSDRVWDTSECDWEYDEESDGYIISKGWYEDTDYCEVLGIIDDFVLAWMPLPKPFEKEQKE